MIVSISFNDDLYNLSRSIHREICIFQVKYEEPPSVIFMSDKLFRAIAYPHIDISSKGKYYFEGIEVKPYPCSEYEYYLAEKQGEFLNFK